MADLSSYSLEELENLAAHLSSSESPAEKTPKPGFISSLGQGAWNFTKGLGRGVAQEAVDLPISVLNAPADVYEYFSGKHIPHIPHPQITNPYPQSLSESIGQNIGQLGGAIALPGGAAVRAVKGAGAISKAIRGGKELTGIEKALAASLGGGAEGALAQEGNRETGALLGAGLGGVGSGVVSATKGLNAIRSKNLAKSIQNEYGRLNEHFAQRFNPAIKSAEEMGANKFLKPEEADLDLLKRGGNRDLVYHLEKYNKNPTLENAHAAQSSLGKLERKYKNAPKSEVGYDIATEAQKAKNRLLVKISEAFEKADAGEHGKMYHKAREEFAKEAAPYLQNPTISKLLGRGSKTGEPTIRPSSFSKMFFKDEKAAEEFLTEMGKKHPELINRETANKIAPWIKYGGALLGGTALGSHLLPHFISNALERAPTE